MERQEFIISRHSLQERLKEVLKENEARLKLDSIQRQREPEMINLWIKTFFPFLMFLKDM